MSLSQHDMGRAFEYSIALCLSEYLPAPIEDSLSVLNARKCFVLAPDHERENMKAAAKEAVVFIVAHDIRLAEKNCTISIQTDQVGRYGDVRDIIIDNTKLKQQVGISAKNRHRAVKHSRLSERIDFGNDWFAVHCSDSYFHKIVPIFRELNDRKQRGEKWRDIPDKRQIYYMPILQAFRCEMALLFEKHPDKVAKSLVKYLLGKYDYYKVIKENGTVSIMSFNIDGTLKWGSKIPLPTRIIEISQKPDSETTLFMTFDHGWQISFRIHNASTLVEPSLKFDINIIGLPSNMSRQVINYLE